MNELVIGSTAGPGPTANTYVVRMLLMLGMSYSKALLGVTQHSWSTLKGMKSSQWIKLIYSRSLSHCGPPPLQPGKTSEELHADNHSFVIPRPPPDVHRCHRLEPAPSACTAGALISWTRAHPSPETTSPCLLAPLALSLPFPAPRSQGAQLTPSAAGQSPNVQFIPGPLALND